MNPTDTIAIHELLSQPEIVAEQLNALDALAPMFDQLVKSGHTNPSGAELTMELEGQRMFVSPFYRQHEHISVPQFLKVVSESPLNNPGEKSTFFLVGKSFDDNGETLPVRHWELTAKPGDSIALDPDKQARAEQHFAPFAAQWHNLDTRKQQEYLSSMANRHEVQVPKRTQLKRIAAHLISRSDKPR